MKRIIPSGRSLKYYALISWVIPGLFAALSCLFFFVASSTFEYNSNLKRIEDDLTIKSNTVARRISAEMLIGRRGAVDSVSRLLEYELNLSNIEITSKAPGCFTNQQESFCISKELTELKVFRVIPAITDKFFVVTSIPVPNLWNSVHVETLIWGCLPIILMLSLGLFFQRFILRNFILRPVESLIETSVGNQETKSHWPKELRDISERLFQTFKDRDEAIFSQIARGVIHDLRTLIHTPLGAVDLVKEQPESGEKRIKRLEHLYEASSIQLPKMRQIIDNTLDGSRTISVNTKDYSLNDTVDESIRNLSTLISQSKTTIHKVNSENLSIPHDKIQLERALTNIIKNGIEACQESGIENLHISTRQQNGWAEISIEDSGFGLPVSKGKIFHPLKSTKTHGSGLGLTVSKKIIEAHGGILFAGKSDILPGAKFTIKLPASEKGVLDVQTP